MARATVDELRPFVKSLDARSCLGVKLGGHGFDMFITGGFVSSLLMVPADRHSWTELDDSGRGWTFGFVSTHLTLLADRRGWTELDASGHGWTFGFVSMFSAALEAPAN